MDETAGPSQSGHTVKETEDNVPGTSTSKTKNRRKNGGNNDRDTTSEDRQSGAKTFTSFRVNLYDESSETKSLFAVAQEEEASGDGKLDIKLPTNSEQYYELEEILMNPARMEGRELTLNAYDMVRSKYNVLDGNNVSEADMQSVISSLSCDVCQEVIQGSIMSKKCGHRFCDQCMSISLIRTNNACPACRQNLGSKRELQQDPRFDQLIYQIIESRCILPRMLAKNREKEKDIYFGRKGYMEGNEKYTAAAKVKTKKGKKKTRKAEKNAKTVIRWFHPKTDATKVAKVSSKRKTVEVSEEKPEEIVDESLEDLTAEEPYPRDAQTILVSADGKSFVSIGSRDGESFLETFPRKPEQVEQRKRLSASIKKSREAKAAKEAQEAVKIAQEKKAKEDEHMKATSATYDKKLKIAPERVKPTATKSLSRFYKRLRLKKEGKPYKSKKKHELRDEHKKNKKKMRPEAEKHNAVYINSRGVTILLNESLKK